MAKPLMSDAEIRRRKKIQGTTSRVGGTLGLVSLGAFGASKVPGAKFMSKTPKLRRVAAGMNTKKLENVALGASTTGAGLGGAASFNFASYTAAEGRKRGPNQKIKKSSGLSAFGIQHD